MSRVGKAQESTEIVLESGDTFWRLSELKYGGRHPIAAIYEINNLTPTVRYENGLRKLIDPIYFAGKSYILPSWAETEDLAQRFYKRIDELYPECNEETGTDSSPKQRLKVTVDWDKTLYAVAQHKRGKAICSEALYEVNQLVPTVVNGPEGKTLRAPVYSGGTTFFLPNDDEIESLENTYRKRSEKLLK
ncbi:MAG: hypothetical protein IAF58_20865 [Leptolyngbya sp.]|nr:hypothetical protein [Candidatus Melainabacteria bacterium]